MAVEPAPAPGGRDLRGRAGPHDGSRLSGTSPSKVWKFNNIIEAPEYVHSVGRDISLYNWYRNSNHLNIERWRSDHFNSGGKSRACEMQRLGLGSYVAQSAGPDKVGLPKGEKEKVLARVRTHRVGWAGQKF